MKIREIKEPKFETILDSGAFSAWSLGQTINIEDYISFIKEHKNNFDIIVNLDVIPGRFGKIPSEEEVEESARKGYENLKYLEKNGIKALPVFHQGEHFSWLDKLMKEEYDYIGISPANDRTTASKMKWLDTIFDFICDEKGFPKIKTHSFGATSLELLARYPFYSADSTTWSRAGRYGSIYIPNLENGVPDFSKSPTILSVSEQALKSNKGNRIDKHYVALTYEEKIEVDKYITSKGFTYDILKISWQNRDKINTLFFLDVEKSLSKNTIFNRNVLSKGFFTA